MTFQFKSVQARALIEEAIENNRGLADLRGVRVRLAPSIAGEVRRFRPSVPSPDKLAF
jgi:hypothetical protein